MKLNDLNRELKLTYSHIIKGYSKRYFKDDVIYLKHYNETELGELEFFYCEAYAQAVDAGLPTEVEKKKEFIDSGQWSNAEEENYERLNALINNQERQVALIFLESQKKKLRSELRENREKFKELSQERETFSKNTCEEFAGKKYGEILATDCIYKDLELKEKYYGSEELELLDTLEFIGVVNLFNNEFKYFSLQNIKRIAASPFFFNPFLFCKNNPVYFFGKPACDLSVHQLNLLSYGATFKGVLEGGKTPPAHVEDIDELIDWYDVAGGAKAGGGTGKATPKRETQASGLVGATKEELELYAASEGGQVVDLNSELAKIKEEKGTVSTMDFKDILDRYK
jgi:hypothetical protein|tara:strand:- start:19968 stop:20990 length:1023 start_codon:yes stop_codon:yes gene_type:complete